jgi:competence protein ComEC
MRKILAFFAVCLFVSNLALAQMKIHVIDVGQADSILLEFKRAAVLVDAGGESTGDERDKEHLISQLNDFFASRPDLHKTLHAVIVSHAHIDHTKLLMDVFQNFTVKNFYDGGDSSGSGAPQLRKARAFAKQNHIAYRAVADESIGKKGLTPPGLRPLKASSGVDMRILTGSRDCDNQNNNSLIVRVQYKDTVALFTGDSEDDGDGSCEEGQISILLERYKDTDLLKTDIYKVGHHGSNNGTNSELVQAMSPKIALISAGKKETKGPGPFHGFFYGHPRESTMELLEESLIVRNPAITGYTYIKGTKDPDATDTIHDDREIKKSSYCTCWDHDITVAVSAAGDKISVSVDEEQAGLTKPEDCP